MKVDAKNVKNAAAKRKQQALEESEPFERESKDASGGNSGPRMGELRSLRHLRGLSRLEYSSMASNVQIELWHAEKVATQASVGLASNGIHYTTWGETRIPESELDHLVAAVPSGMSAALSNRTYYFVPLAIADTGETMIAPVYSVDLGDRAVCHRNAAFGTTEAVFLSTRLVEDRFGLAFEFFINVAHNFVEVSSGLNFST